MKIIVSFELDSDMIDCPQGIINKLTEYRKSFIDWIFDVDNDHSYWIYEDGKKFGVSYRAEAFVEWLNMFVLKDKDKATLIESKITEWDSNLPLIGF